MPVADLKLLEKGRGELKVEWNLAVAIEMATAVKRRLGRASGPPSRLATILIHLAAPRDLLHGRGAQGPVLTAVGGMELRFDLRHQRLLAVVEYVDRPGFSRGEVIIAGVAHLAENRPVRLCFECVGELIAVDAVCFLDRVDN